MKKFFILLFIPISSYCQDIQPLEMQGMIEAHNECRESLNLPPLVWSKKLAKKSLKWAKKLKRDNYCLYKHSPKENRENIGENISWNQGYSMQPREVAEFWISEQKYFDFDTRICKTDIDSCGHYTQIIWRDTKKVGCAIVQCGDEQVWVCQYEPAGNILFNDKIMSAY
jgi:pathogenesis-related protein 1